MKMGPFTMVRNFLFRKGLDDRLRRCVNLKQALQVMHNFHTHSRHYGVEATIRKIMNAGYWWPIYLKEIYEFLRACPICQYQGKLIVRDNWPLTFVIPTGLFAKWGIDFIGPISLISQATRSRYIIFATDYASKWVEAKASKKNDGRTT
jgi:hypothetical protein